MKGIYVAAGPNPIFLRLFMTQIARQKALPDVLAIYENGNSTSAFDWACGEITEELKARGVNVLHTHASAAANSASRYFYPLKTLIDSTETTTFLKMDLDDFYSDKYVENMSRLLGTHNVVINQNCAIALVRPFHGDFKYKSPVVMKHSPIGAAPSHIAFDRKFAIKYLGYLAGNLEKNDRADDDLMAECFEGMDVSRVDGVVDYTYVSHGNNHSSYAWQSTGGRIYLD